MTDADKAELAEIERAEKDVKKMRVRFFAKLRQRAFRHRRRPA